MADEQDIAEGLDDDKLPPELAPDEPYGVDRYGTTAAEERWDQPIDERVAAEVPDDLALAEDERARGFDLLEPDEGARPDTEAAAVAQLVEPELDDTALEREGVRPAEEAAMQIIDDVDAY
jgi:hypothetical protein